MLNEVLSRQRRTRMVTYIFKTELVNDGIFACRTRSSALWSPALCISGVE